MQEFSPEGAFIAAFGASGVGSGQLAGPRGVAVGSSGAILVADSRQSARAGMDAAVAPANTAFLESPVSPVARVHQIGASGEHLRR